MRAEVISIGDELISGVRLDTNTQWLSQQLGDLGIQSIRHTTVGDDLPGNVEAFQLAANRADIVICSGGLGPTLDDLTREAMAVAFDRQLVLDPRSLEHIQSLFARRSRPMPESNRLQAMFPEGATAIPNPHGSAPGIDLLVERDGRRCRLFALPGVPAEMKQMWPTVVERLEAMSDVQLGRLRYHALKLFGIGESDVEVLLPNLIDRSRSPTVGITVSRATITLRIAGRAHSDSHFSELVQPTIHEIQQSLGDLIFGEGDEELEDVVLRRLNEKQLSLATVEIGASSLVGDWLLRASGSSSNIYKGSIAFPSLQLALEWMECGDDRAAQSIDESQSAELYERIAMQARQRFRADVVLALGIYPPTAQMQNASEPFPLTWVVADSAGSKLQQQVMGGHPDVLPARIAKTGLDFVRKLLK